MSNIDPSSARTAEDFVMLLRQARAMSQLTFWQLEEAANAAGHELEPTMLAETLGLAALPDETLVTALLAACGYPPEQVDHWLAVRDRLASAAFADRSAGPGAWSRPGFPATSEPAWVPLLDPDPTPDPGPGAPPVWTPADRAHNAGPQDAGPHNAGPQDAGPRSGGALDATASLPEIPAAAARARHTLRIPGRGTRRARGSSLRPLLMAAAAMVVLAGGIAVIVWAINDGEGNSGAPVYATGESPAPAPQPSEPALAEITATLSPPPSPSHPSVSASAPPALAGVLRNGTATLQNGQSIDLDGGGSDPDIVVFGDGDGVRAGPSDRHFALEPTATKQACEAAGGYQKTLQNLTAGNGICVRTDKGRYAHLTVTRTGPLAFSYVVWS